jgi:ABC-type polysaccharide/polyol phosphate transport system ATPase subunit
VFRMVSDVLIEAKSIGLSVPVYLPQERSILRNPTSLLSDFYFNNGNRQVQVLLSDLSFSILAGQRLAVIGVNGAGKSTLLRLLGGIYRPTKGHLTINCEPKGLFDVSIGLLGDATGLENLYLRGLEMGLTINEIRQLMPQILEFSELSDAIDKPFNTYSTGMRLRLAVSLALSIQPDVMLLDEWIGAGDAAFQAKVTDRMNKLVDGSRALVLASHNDALLKRVCSHGIVLHKGRSVFMGGIDESLAHYHQHIRPSQKKA